MEPPKAAEQVSVDDFFQIDVRVGTVVRAEPFPEVRKPAYKLWIDFGQADVRQSSAQITDLYALDDLPGRLVVAATNLPPRRIAGFESHVLVLGCLDAKGRVALLTPDRDVPLGGRVH
jgi:tRNA-binding protein